MNELVPLHLRFDTTLKKILSLLPEQRRLFP
jgi:hypothetical protein